MIYHANINQNKDGVSTLLFDKVNFWPKNTSMRERFRQGHKQTSGYDK